MTVLGTAMAVASNLKDETLGMSFSSCHLSDSQVLGIFGEDKKLSPALFWSFTFFVLKYEQSLKDQSETLIGEDIYGLVMYVQKESKTYVLNLYREEPLESEVRYRLRMFPAGNSWEAGHIFVEKVLSK